MPSVSDFGEISWLLQLISLYYYNSVYHMTYARGRQRVNRTWWIAVCKCSSNVVNVCICLYVLLVIVIVNIVS